MTVTENLGALGSWSLSLSDAAPLTELQRLGYFGHVAIWRGRVDVTAAADGDLLRAARYVGVLREKDKDGRQLSGAGMLFWLGDEDHKGKVIETKLVLTGKTLTQCLTAVLPPAVTLGTVYDPGGTYTGTHQWQTPRDALDVICTAFQVEYRVNGDGTLDVGAAPQLYPAAPPIPAQGLGTQPLGTSALGGAPAVQSTAPDSIIAARRTGRDMDMQALGGEFDPQVSAVDYSSRVVLVGQATDSAGNSTQFATGSASAPTVPYKDIHGNTVAMTRMISESGQTSGSVGARAQLQLNRFNRTTQVLKVTATDYEMSGNFVVGDACYVYDPDNGIIDATQEITFRGEVLHPAVIRVVGITWSVTDGHTVAFRTQDGEWIDLTRWVVWESGSNEVVVGDLPKTLTSSSNPVLDRQDAAGDGSTPNAPTGLTLTTTSVESSVGQSTAVISASWTAPATNTDGSVITDLSYYMVRYRWQGRAPQWTGATQTASTTVDIPGLAVGLVYDVEVAAVDTTGHVSDYTAVASITAAPDQTAPNPPSDPVVTSYLGQLRIAWDGKDNTGAAMPPDFAIVEVHVSATSGFTPVAGPGSTTLVSELSTAGAAYATAPYGVTRYVKLVAVDNSFNRSAPSGQASGATTQVADGDIASLNVGKLVSGTTTADIVNAGRITTALTGARVEHNSLGFQGFQADGVTKWLSLTATESLLTGTFKTALTGRRIQMGAAGMEGYLNFYAPDNSRSYIQSYTESTGLEALQVGVGDPASANLQNRINMNSQAWTSIRSNRLECVMGDYFAIYDGSSDMSNSKIVFYTSGGETTVYDGIYTRLHIGNYPNNAQLAYYDVHGRGRLFINEDNANSSLAYYDDTVMRLNLMGDRFDFYAANASGLAGIYGINSYGSNGSLALRFYASNGHASNFKLWSDSTGDFFEFRDWSESLWLGLRAGAFQVNSDASAKTGIVPFTGSALTKVRSAKVKQYRRKGPPKTKTRKVPGENGHDIEIIDGADESYTPPDGPVEIGLIAQEAPAQIVVPMGGESGIDLYQMGAMTWAGLSELADQVDALVAQVATLTKGKP